MDTKDNVGLLYNALKKQGFNDIGNENIFRSKMANENNRKILYEALNKKGFNDIGDYDTFNSKLNTNSPSILHQEQSQPRPKSPYVEGKGEDTMIFGVPYADYQQMTPEEQSKQYSAAIEKRKNDEKDFFSNYISGQLGEIDSELNNKREPLPMPAGSAFIPSSAVGAAQRFGNGDTKETQDRYTSLHAAKNLLDDANKLVEEAKKGDTGFFSSLGRGFKDKFMDTDNWTMGLIDTAYSGLLRKAIEKEESGEELSPEESKLLDAAAVNMATQAYFSSDMSRGYKAGSTTAQSIPFMLEFAVNPISSSGNALAKGLLKHGLKRFGRASAEAAGRGALNAFGRAATSNVAKVAGRLVGDAAAAAGMTVTTSIGRVASGTNERMIGDVQAKVEDGDIKYAGRENSMNFDEALGKSAISNFLENQSEMFFNAFAGGGKLAKEALNKFIPGFSKLSNSEIVQFISKIKNNPTIKNVAERTQFHGLLGEYAEEVYNNFANIPLGEMTVEQATDLDNNIDTFLGLAPTSAAFGLLGLGGIAREKYTTQRNLHRFRDGLNEEDKTLFDELQQVINAGDQETTKAFIERTLADENLSPEEKKERVFAVQGMQEEKVLEDVQNEDVSAGVTPEDIEANKIDIYRNFKRAERKVNSLLPEEIVSQLDAVSDLGQFASANNLNEQQVSTLADYLPAKEIFSQYVDHTNSRKEEAKMQAREQAITDVERISNPETGFVTQVKHKFADNPVYLVGGNLSFGEDGFLDRDNSSETVYYVDETGERKMAQAEDFDSVLSEVPIDDMIVQAEANAEQDFIANEKESLHSPDIPAPGRGETVVIGGETYLIENPDEDMPGNYSAIKLNAAGKIEVPPGLGARTSISPDEYYAAKEAELWPDENRETEVEDAESDIPQQKKILPDGRFAVQTGTDGSETSYDILDRNGNVVDSDIMPSIDYSALADYVMEEESVLPNDGIQGTEDEPQGLEEGTVSQEEQLQDEAEQQEEPESALSRIPLNEAQEPDFESATMEDTGAALLEMNDGDVDEAKDTAVQMVSFYDGELKKAEKMKTYASNPMQIQKLKAERRAKIDEVNAKRGYWQSVADVIEQGRKKATLIDEAAVQVQKNEERLASMAPEEQLAAQQKVQEKIDKGAYSKPKSSSSVRYIKEDGQLGEAVTPQEYVLREIATGRIRFKWGDKGTTHGLASHTGLSGSESERRSRVWAFAADGMTPEEASEVMFDNMPDYVKKGVEQTDVFNMVLDAFQSHKGPKAMFDEAKRLHGSDVEEEQPGYDKEMERQRMEWEAEQNYMNVEDYQAYQETIDLYSEEQYDMMLDNDLMSIFAEKYMAEMEERAAKEKAVTSSVEADKEQQGYERSGSNNDVRQGVPEGEKLPGRNTEGDTILPEEPTVESGGRGPGEGSRTDNYDQGEQQGVGELYPGIVLGEQKTSLSEDPNSGVVSNESLENIDKHGLLNAEQPTASDLSVAEPSSLPQENGSDALNYEDNSAPLQGDNQKYHENGEVSESIPQGEHGTLSEISGEQEESIYQLRRRIEEASRDASESEGSRGNQQKIKPIRVGSFGAIYNQSNKEAATPIDKKTDTGENQIDLQSDTALLQDVGSSSVDRDSELSVNKQKNPRFTAPQPEAGEDLIDYASRISEAKRLFDAEQEVDTTPTEAQKSAGNYKKGHINIGGYDITIENPKGSERSGVDANGQPWSVTMNNSYGYIRGTEGVDGDHIDVFLSDNPADGKVYVIDQINEDGSFDEHKVMYGFPSAETARAAYLANYSSGWKGLGTITEVSKDEFKKWIKSSHRKTKPFVDYKSVKTDFLSPQENSSETTVNLPKSKSDTKNKKRAADIKRARYELMDAKRELSVAQATNSGYIPEEVEEKKKRVEEAENELKKLAGIKNEDKSVFSATSSSKSESALEIPAMTEEEYIASKGYGFSGIGDVALHKGKQRTSKQQDKAVKSQAKKDKDYTDRREVLRKEYRDKLSKGELREPNTIERLLKTANGNPDNEGTHAARRALQKRGIDWQENSIRFREMDDSDITSFAQKHNLNEDDVRKYEQSMNIGNLGGASYAFKNIKRNIRLLNSDLSLGEFVKTFAPVEKELYEKFGNVDALRDEYVQREMENRNVMEAARKRAEEVAEAERKRLEKFELMTDEEMDASYFNALEENGESRMRDIVNEAARRKGYVSADEFRMAHRAPSYDEEGIDKNMVDIAVNKDQIRESLDELLHMNRDKYRDESASAINEALSAIDEGKRPMVTIYRAVPKSLKEGKVRNGDWVSLSESYVKVHGEHVLNGNYRIMREKVSAENLYWDGNDINEWGYDDRSDYHYKDTKNNRKLSDLITRDDSGNIIPPSKRFNTRKADTRFREKDFYSKEEQSIIDKAKEDGSYMKAPNGKKTSLSDKQWVQVRTKAFKNWFGDWENSPKDASKVVDKNGEPLVVYHGTLSKSIERFRKDMIGSRYSYDESGFFFTDKESIAKDYSTSEFDSAVKGDIIPVFLNIRKPIMADNRWAVKNGLGNALKNMDSIEFWDNYQSFMLDEIEDKKTDGAIINDGSSKMVVVFEPNQIKSATENIGGFSSYNDAIRLRENSEDPHEINTVKVLAAITKLSDVLHTPIHMLRTVEELPDGVAKRAIERGRNIKAWYDTNTGEVSVYIPNINNVADAVTSVLHEVVGHKGLRDLFGKEKFDGMMEKLYAQLPDDVRKKVHDVAENKYKGNIAVAMDEYLAEQAEKDEIPSWWNRIVSAVRDFLREIGIDVKLTGNDLKYLLWKSKNRLMNTDDGIAVINKIAADESMKERFHIGEYSRTPAQEKADYDRATKVVSDFAKSHTGAANALLVRSREMLREQLEAIGMSDESIDEIEGAFNSGEAVAVYNEETGRVIISNNGASDKELKAYLWHENTHRAIREIFGNKAEEVIEPIYEWLSAKSPKGCEIVRNKYSERNDAAQKEECIVKFVEDKIKKSGEETFQQELENASPIIKEVFEGIFNFIAYGTTERTREESNKLLGRTLGTGYELEVRNSGNARAGEEKKGAESEGARNEAGSGERQESNDKGVRFRESDNSANEQIKELNSRITSLEKKISRFENQEELRRSVTEFIRGEIDSSLVGYFGKQDLNSLLVQAQNAKSIKSLEKIVMNVKNVIMNAQRRKLQRMIDKLLSLQVQDVNGKNMSIAKNVDDSTRKIFSFLRGKVSDLVLSGFEDDMKYLRRSGREKREEITRLHSLLTTAKTEKEKNNINKQISSLETEVEEGKSQLKDLQAEADAVKEQILNAGDVDIDAEMKRLDEKMDNAAMGKDTWTQGDTERMAALNILQGIFTNRKHDAGIEGIEVDKQKLILNNSDLYRKRIGKNETERKRLTEQINENHRRIVAYDRLVNDIRSTQIKQMEMTVEELNELISNGRNNLLRRKEKEMQRKRELISGAIRSVEGKPIDIFKKNQSKEHWAKKFFSAPMGSFEYMCKRVNTKTLGKDGFLYKCFIAGDEGVLKAYDTYVSGMKELRTRLDDKCGEVFGESFEAVSSKSDKVVEKSGVYVTQSENERGKGYGVRYELPLTKGQAMYIYQVWKMNDGRTKLELQGFDEESVAQIADFIGTEYVLFADWVQDELLKDLREKYNAKYLEMFNTSLAEIENYIPLKIRKEAVRQEASLSEDGNKRKTLEEKAGSLINRTVNTKPVDITYSGFDVLLEHGSQMEEWNAYARVRKDLDYILSSIMFRNQLNANVRGSYESFYDAAEVAAKANHPDSAKYGDEILGKLSKGIVGGNIAFRLNTALKQVLSAPAFLGYSQSPLYIAHLTKNAVKPYADVQWCMKNIPSFYERVKSGTAGNEKLDEKSFSRWMDKYIEIGMIPNKLVDAITCSIGAKSIFDYKFAQLKKSGLKEEEARNQALAEADIYYNATQQSSHPAFMSPMQMSRTFTDRMLTTYQNSNIGYVRKLMAAFYDLSRSLKWQELKKNYTEIYMKEEGLSELEAESKAYRRLLNENRKSVVEIALFGWGLNMLWNIGSQGLLGFFRGDGDDDKWAKDLAFMLTSPIKGVPGGNLLESIASGYGMNPFLVYDELDKFMKESKKAIEEDGLISPQMAYITLAKASRYAGVDLEVWGNVYLGVEGLVRDGALEDDGIIDLMYILNSPKSSRVTVAKDLYKNEPILEYAKKIARAYKYIPKKNAWENWVPGAKPLTKRKENEVKKEAERMQMTPKEREDIDKMEKKKKHLRKLKELSNDPEAQQKYRERYKEEITP
jgi:hypothetical protein